MVSARISKLLRMLVESKLYRMFKRYIRQKVEIMLKSAIEGARANGIPEWYAEKYYWKILFFIILTVMFLSLGLGFLGAKEYNIYFAPFVVFSWGLAFYFALLTKRVYSLSLSDDTPWGSTEKEGIHLMPEWYVKKYHFKIVLYSILAWFFFVHGLGSPMNYRSPYWKLFFLFLPLSFLFLFMAFWLNRLALVEKRKRESRNFS